MKTLSKKIIKIFIKSIPKVSNILYNMKENKSKKG